jgi:hypothetical protein
MECTFCFVALISQTSIPNMSSLYFHFHMENELLNPTGSNLCLARLTLDKTIDCLNALLRLTSATVFGDTFFRRAINSACRNELIVSSINVKLEQGKAIKSLSIDGIDGWHSQVLLHSL